MRSAVFVREVRVRARCVRPGDDSRDCLVLLSTVCRSRAEGMQLMPDLPPPPLPGTLPWRRWGRQRRASRPKFNAKQGERHYKKDAERRQGW